MPQTLQGFTQTRTSPARTPRPLTSPSPRQSTHIDKDTGAGPRCRRGCRLLPPFVLGARRGLWATECHVRGSWAARRRNQHRETRRGRSVAADSGGKETEPAGGASRVSPVRPRRRGRRGRTHPYPHASPRSPRLGGEDPGLRRALRGDTLAPSRSPVRSGAVAPTADPRLAAA